MYGVVHLADAAVAVAVLLVPVLPQALQEVITRIGTSDVLQGVQGALLVPIHVEGMLGVRYLGKFVAAEVVAADDLVGRLRVEPVAVLGIVGADGSSFEKLEEAQLELGRKEPKYFFETVPDVGHIVVREADNEVEVYLYFVGYAGYEGFDVVKILPAPYLAIGLRVERLYAYLEAEQPLGYVLLYVCDELGLWYVGLDLELEYVARPMMIDNELEDADGKCRMGVERAVEKLDDAAAVHQVLQVGLDGRHGQEAYLVLQAGEAEVARVGTSARRLDVADLVLQLFVGDAQVGIDALQLLKVKQLGRGVLHRCAVPAPHEAGDIVHRGKRP